MFKSNAFLKASDDKQPYPESLALPYIENFHGKDYSALTIIWNLTQTKNGFYYFSSRSGILEYDGTNWNMVFPQRGNYVIEADSKGRLYYYDSRYRNFGYLEPTNGEFFNKVELFREMKAINHDEEKEIRIHENSAYFISDSYIDFWNGEKLKSWKSRCKYGASAIINGHLHVYDENVGILKFQNDSLLVFNEDAFLKNNFIKHILPLDSSSMILSIEDKGLYILKGKKYIPFSTDIKHLSRGIKLSDGCFAYIKERDGIIILNEEGEIVRKINETNGLSYDMASELHQDRNGNIWVSTLNGISKIEYSQAYWIDKRHDVTGNIWRVKKHENNLYAFTRNGFKWINLESSDSEMIRDEKNICKAETILKTSCHDILVHNNKLLSIACEGIYLIDQNKTRKLDLFSELPKDYLHRFFVSNYDTNRIFVTTDKGLGLLYNKAYLKEEGIIKELKSYLLGDDKEGYLWTINMRNIERFKFINKKDNSITINNPEITKYKIDTNIIKNQRYFPFFYSGEIYLSTLGNIYIFNKKEEKFQRHEFYSEFLNEDEIVTKSFIQEDKNVLLFLIKNVKEENKNCIVVLNKGEVEKWDYSFFKVYDEKALNHISYQNNSTYWLCTNRGLILYDKEKLSQHHRSPNTFIKKITIGNDSVIYFRKPEELKNMLVAYQSNTISFDYTITSYLENRSNRFQYKLEGLTDNWSIWTAKSSVNFANIREGEYTFKVRGKDYAGKITKENSFSFKVLPPWYRTIYAYVVYALILILLVYLVIKWRIYKIQKDKNRLEISIVNSTKELNIKNKLLEKQAQELKEMDKLKSNFFANISHEFRTPLTLILGPLQEISKSIKDKKLGNKLELIKKHAEKLRKQINQLLELSKFEAKLAKANCEYYKINKLVKQVAASFGTLADIKKIDLNLDLLSEELVFLFDKEKMETVISNLLSNALKFTAENGVVSLKLSIDESSLGNQLIMLVEDSGIGISKDNLPFIFSRFYQADSSKTRRYEGTGIGLALVKEIIELHQGKIEAISEIGRGTSIKVMLPVKTGFEKKEIESKMIEEQQIDFVPDNFEIIEPDSEAHVLLEREKITMNKPNILIVEDNEDMRMYIAEILEDLYEVFFAVNGKQGLKEATEKIPDLVVTDLMMPEMDGFQMSQQIRENILTSHIPIVLLTAKADNETKMDGLNTGVDDFLQKPFLKDELLIRVSNLINQRILLRNKYETNIIISPENTTSLSMDDKFLQSVGEYLEKNMSNEDYSIEKLSSDIGFSYRSFHRKIKSLTGDSPSQLVLKYKLKKAAHLIDQKAALVGEVAYLCGFRDSSYFTKCFKKQFGCLPSEYNDQKNI